jgi:hypothetical protein
MVDLTGIKDPVTGWFLPGHAVPSGAGRPRGSRNRLAEAMVDDLYQDWISHGIQAITACREERPSDYLKIVAMIVLKASEDPNIDSEKRDAAIEQFIEDAGSVP